MSQELVERFRTENLTFGVIGLGYVGLPLAIEAARSGVTVLGFDVNEKVTTGINAGRSHIQDLTHHDIEEQVQAGRLEATTDMARLAECGAISICVPTPLSKTRFIDVASEINSAMPEFVVGKALTDELISSVDVAVIVTDHSTVDHARVLELAPIVVDSRNATKGLVPPSAAGTQEGWIVKGPRV